MALEELDGCSDAYVDPRAGITLLFSEPKEVDEKALQELLKTYKIRISDLKKVDKMPY
ncbi:MAG: hypothetical protein ACKJSK_17870 [Roseibacillus sp.]